VRAASCRGPGTLVLEDVPAPEPGAGEVVVRVRTCGICGSDLHWYHGHVPPPAVCPGHEIAGEVAAVGAGVTALREGDAVAVEAIAACGACVHCLAGAYQRCPRVQVVGVTRAGGFADLIALPARHCFRLPSALPWATAALAEPLGVAVHAVRLARLGLGERVLVLGGGTIGLLAVLAARVGGASEVLVTARRPQQKAAAHALGADRVLDDADVDGLHAEARRAPIDLVIETVGGAAETIDAATAAVRPGGTVVVLGVFTREPPLPALRVLLKEIRLLGSFVYGRDGVRADFDVALDVLRRDGARIAAALVTHRFSLDEIDRAFATAGDKTSGAIKVSVAP
jgi:L-iditol 2-dehydrogenase